MSNATMSESSTDWSALSLVPGAELIVGWRPRRSRLDAAAIELSRDVAATRLRTPRAATEPLAPPYRGTEAVKRRYKQRIISKNSL
jgi:hypothetical protein